MHVSLVELLKELKSELESMLNISADEVNKRREETKVRIQEIRFKVSRQDT